MEQECGREHPWGWGVGGEKTRDTWSSGIGREKMWDLWRSGVGREKVWNPWTSQAGRRKERDPRIVASQVTLGLGLYFTLDVACMQEPDTRSCFARELCLLY
ncbi:hypothetical protein NDU88_005088 [Pleurodeles waltl]|uniref:Uncharacterized protein n=1 Tax=Pleurodeles waltl TaxID=8319 RepID=A0AAV7VI24_PLEWA|nr:hypothetical protein NDU88_005088 [Pleurodeles waltl]